MYLCGILRYNYYPCKNSPAVKKGKAKNAQVTDFGI